MLVENFEKTLSPYHPSTSACTFSQLAITNPSKSPAKK
jgi:hypothetical protein